MVGRTKKGPQETEGFNSAIENPTGIMVTTKDIRRMVINNELDRDVRYN